MASGSAPNTEFIAIVKRNLNLIPAIFQHTNHFATGEPSADFVLAAVAGIGFTDSTPKAEAQVSVDTGVAPECPYGYYDAAPHNCITLLPLDTGYYGPE